LAIPGPSGLRLPTPRKRFVFGSSSLALRRHLSVLACSSLLKSSSAPVDVSKPLTQAPCLSFPTLQHFRSQRPFFSPQLLLQRLANVAVFPRSPVPRVWLPSRRCQLLVTLAVSFNSQRSWASLSRAFILPCDRKKVSLSSLRPCTSSTNQGGLQPVLRRLAPAR
jgi:hypothetical protein